MQDFSPLYGEIETISPLIRRITANNPAPYTFKGTGTYIIGHGNVAVIDPGPNLPEHIEAILKALNGETISHILVTHNHKDHSPAAMPLSIKCGAKIYAFNVSDQQHSETLPEEGIDKDFKPDVIINDGDVIKGENWTVEAVHTPGHLSNHICFALREEKALFTGDHIMGWSTTIISPPDGNMQDYMDSLQKLIMRDDEIYYPTHGWPIEKPTKFVSNILKHRLVREKTIVKEIKAGHQSIPKIIKKLYPKLPANLYIAAERTVLAHLIRLIDISEVECGETPTENSTYKMKT
ncbi:MAG: MBL fold metallo-hydrolase [Emcibacteraceae bacterium]|nr:MBL fold metallo-hydrolase [Emcibacteraceae bacterium]